MKHLWLLTAKDLRIEYRSRQAFQTTLFFALLILIIFQFAFDPNPRVIATVGPGIVWVAYLFAGILGLGRTFVLERDGGTLARDRVQYAVPGGSLVDYLFVARDLKRVFAFRQETLRRIFEQEAGERGIATR